VPKGEYAQPKGVFNMRSPNDLWEALGDVNQEEAHHVLTRLFDMYEQLLKIDPQHKEALLFFRNLDNAIVMTDECNLNRR
jgi:hypothetical protein